MQILSTFLLLGLQRPPTEVEMRGTAAKSVKAVFNKEVAEKDFKYKKGPPTSFRTAEFVVYFSNREKGRLSGLIHHTSRMKDGPKQGKKFKTIDEWERHGISIVHKVWPDLDGYLSAQEEIGEQSFTAKNRTSWFSDSNTKNLIWFTHPVKGKIRMFSASFDLGSGEPLNLMCAALVAEKKHPFLLDNSKKRQK